MLDTLSAPCCFVRDAFYDTLQTYNDGNYDDAWRAVQQYRHVTSFSRDHPEEGYASIATALKLPKTRVRSWIDADKTPSVVTGLYTARDRNWIDLTTNDDQLIPLNVLIANVYSGGMIATDHWQPVFTLNEAGFESECITALELAGVGYTVRKEDNENRGPSVRPGEDGAILGRVMHVLGAPVGQKSQDEELSLPRYLEAAPLEVRTQFVRSYLRNRSVTKESGSIQIIEARPHSYREELADLIESITGERVTVGERSVTVSAAAVEKLGLEIT
ncbi:hypothetical protein Natpe_1738 [Natrinema pellirubrum DSM 15624]|uniref:Uncharacterized protein n=1 Tax=Natrinema pellirubrum (strain DSM 15624 / CIP 106293 / JCM 10476 / NCIMB 786 / 157) TaxID=797303 RepID=L0JM08_NATP1|nr:hypothetical protein [Natrinema pellirubrum]AGB31627.1 hypothetical protein Natpe_1738 [Natrinema pellirubrum DSM 15624]